VNRGDLDSELLVPAGVCRWGARLRGVFWRCRAPGYERAELSQLRREVRTLRMERDILKKATAFFAKENA
jgi:transposase